MTLTIGIDLGGTNVRGAVWDGSDTLQHRIEQESKAKREPEQLLRDLVSLIQELEQRAGESVEAIGFGIPGIVDSERGVVFQSPHFPKWREFHIREKLQEQISTPLFIDNDANCFALGEDACGAGQGRDHMIGLTLGTGLGGGIIIKKEIYHGERGFAAELGHLVIETDGAPCFCGGRGCLEMYASATGLKRLLVEAPLDDTKKAFLDHVGKSVEDIMPNDMAQAASGGDPFAAVLFNRFGHYLGLGIASMVNVLGIYTIVIGGGISCSWDLFMEATRKAFEAQSYAETVRITEIKPAKLGNDAGIIGASYGAAMLARKAS